MTNYSREVIDSFEQVRLAVVGDIRGPRYLVFAIRHPAGDLPCLHGDGDRSRARSADRRDGLAQLFDGLDGGTRGDDCRGRGRRRPTCPGPEPRRQGRVRDGPCAAATHHRRRCCRPRRRSPARRRMAGVGRLAVGSAQFRSSPWVCFWVPHSTRTRATPCCSGCLSCSRSWVGSSSRSTPFQPNWLDWAACYRPSVWLISAGRRSPIAP